MGYGTSSSFLSTVKSSARRVASNISHHPDENDSTSHANTPLDQDESLGLITRRSSISSRSSHPSPYNRSRAASTSTPSLSQIPDRKPVPSRPSNHQASSSSSVSFQRALSTVQNPDGFLPPNLPASTYVEHNQSTSSLFMATVSSANGSRLEHVRTPSLSQSTSSFGQASGGSVPVPALPPAPSGMSQNPHTVFQQIHDMSSKRISTLDYLRKAHDGRVYWFNTLLFTKVDLSKMPFFEPKKLARRATNYLLLGLSLPNILDMNASNPLEYLRTLNALLVEFEAYQQAHPPDGSSASSLSRARLPSMFKRATHVSGKGRRTSSATDIGLPMNSIDPGDLKLSANGAVTASATASSFPASDQDLLPGEEYTHLLTPSLPFDPDFFETFTTLCDVLIDCYTRIMSLTSSPATILPGTGEIFAKADARLRKIMVAGVTKEFEDASRSGTKAELAGLSKVVLGGLM